MKTCLRKLKLYGDLAEHLGVKEIEIDVATVAKSIKCLLAYYPKAESYMMNRSYRVLVEDRPTELEELHYPAGKGDIKIIPVITGEGGRGLGSILLGGILIGAAIIAPGAGFALGSGGMGFVATGGAVASPFMATVGNLGVVLLLGGITQMLTPLPQTPKEDPEKSFAFNSPVNVSRAGLVIPLIYGQALVGSSVISAAIETNTVKDDINPFDIFKQ
tara:strand:+ start:2418 stop:3068 length:651 start_codon:yes stop_codon:yes gene_type:complete